MGAKGKDPDWNGRHSGNEEERARRTKLGKADVRRLHVGWWLASVAQYDAERTAENLKELIESWRVWRGK